ncbi:NAD dependent epimerase [Mycena latifolia]|nr:NAD dependent epimerase [Mycena latifolia]
MRTALGTLGYKDTHHMQNAIDAKYEGKGISFGRAERDQLLGNCQAVTAVPATLFSEELIAAYTDAKRAHGRPIRCTSGKSEASRCVEMMLGAPAADAQEAESIARYKAHYENVKAMVPPERLLEVEIGEGWERLCAFLGEEVPVGAFPHTNDAKAIRDKGQVAF